MIGAGQLDLFTSHGMLDTARIVARMTGRKIAPLGDSLMTTIVMVCWKRCTRRVGVGPPYSPALPLSVLVVDPKEKRPRGVRK
ncbi:hypothetical protein NDU88_006618 [Pleurodeles waltl]|uniref:Uncharacterized protein n=1 Tax=Pleurodeles waltl TaxID=8319 RepID=A0AAV7L4N4_PLEWA|nr:hypothetical protein NDU88_006618 [Pleurodeles waltl]